MIELTAGQSNFIKSKNQKNPNRSWPKVKEFLEERIVAMNRLV